MTCSIEGCEQPRNGKAGLCAAHRMRAKKGLPMEPPIRLRGDTFDKKVQVAPSGCWQWTGATTSGGYGAYRGRPAHRISYERHRGPIPDGLHLDHLCRNRCCVNPAHLEPVTPKTNVLRGDSPAAISVRTNRCGRGHEFTPENTLTQSNGRWRECRACRLMRKARYRAQKRAAKAVA